MRSTTFGRPLIAPSQGVHHNVRSTPLGELSQRKRRGPGNHDGVAAPATRGLDRSTLHGAAMGGCSTAVNPCAGRPSTACTHGELQVCQTVSSCPVRRHSDDLRREGGVLPKFVVSYEYSKTW